MHGFAWFCRKYAGLCTVLRYSGMILHNFARNLKIQIVRELYVNRRELYVNVREFFRKILPANYTRELYVNYT